MVATVPVAFVQNAKAALGLYEGMAASLLQLMLGSLEDAARTAQIGLRSFRRQECHRCQCSNACMREGGAAAEMVQPRQRDASVQESLGKEMGCCASASVGHAPAECLGLDVGRAG